MSGVGADGWANLGAWSAETEGYRAAAEALARRVGDAADIGPGDRVLDLGCGLGASLALWSTAYRAARVVGIEADPARLDAARRRAPQAAVYPRSPAGTHDVVVAVDAAYHFDTPSWIDAAAARLRPGGRLAFTTFVRRGGGIGVRAAARLCRFGAGQPQTQEELQMALAEAGFEQPRLTDLSAPVLDGFVDWVEAGAPHGPDVSATALTVTRNLCRLVRARGLADYALVSTRRAR